jgi:hypothetical protein
MMRRAPFGAVAYTIAFLVVVALAATSLALSQIDLGRAQLPLALGIAAVKAMVIAAVFIGVARMPPSMILMVAIAVALSLSLVAFVIMDVMTR